MDCSEELLVLLHELLGMIESINAQDADVMETLSKRIFHLFQQDFGEFSQLSPSFHRALAHSADSPDTIKTKVSPSESCQRRRKRR